MPRDPILKAKDTRQIEISIPPAAGDTHVLGEYIMKAAADGLTLSGAATLEHGQRDPIVHGLRLTFTRES